jgi:hypothetical protein
MLRWQTTWFLWLLLTIATPLAQADATLLDQRFTIGSPAREVAIQVRSAADLTLTVSGTRHVLATQNVTSASAEVVALTAQASIAIVRLRSDSAEWVALVGGKRGTELLAFERSDMHGDPGERQAFVVDVSAADAAGKRQVVVGTRHEGLSLCSERPALTGRRVLNESTLTLVPSALSAPQDALSVTPQVAHESTAPRVHMLVAQASSAIDPNTRSTAPARSLVDGRGDTLWAAPAFSFASFRNAVLNLPLERLEVRLPSPDKGQAPGELWLFGDGEKSMHVALPADVEVVSIPVAPGFSTRCLAVMVGAGKHAQKPVALGELRAFSSVDREGGIDALVAELVRDGAEAQRAGDVLTALGLPGAQAVAAHFDELSLRQKRRALTMLARALPDESARARLVEAARSPDAELAEPALHVLSTAGANGKMALRELAHDATATGDLTAKLLARDPEEGPVLLATLAQADNAARPELRRAIAMFAQRYPQKLTAALADFRGQNPSVRARVGLALALSRVDGQTGEVTALLEQSLPDAQDFEDRYRVALAALHAGSSSALDAWLEREALHAEEWMMRHGAYAALDKRLPARSAELSRALARDDYPRVRALAQATLSRTGSWSQLEQTARSDTWPLVRVAAVKGLAPHVESGAVLKAALEDPARSVRAAAIDALAAQKSEDAWPLVRARLVAPGEWPVVRSAAMRFASALCRQDAREDLVSLARAVARPDAAERDEELGVEALKALHGLGGKGAQEARQILARDGVPPAAKRVLDDAAPSTCRN